MVKVGFICEGFTEQILLLSDKFQQLLISIKLQLVNVINATGSGNLLPHNIKGYTESLEKDGAEVIIILTDLDEDICVTKTKERIKARETDIVIIAVKKIESWFLANDDAMQLLLNNPHFSYSTPEKEHEPFETINGLLVNHTGRGIGKKSAGKIKLVYRLLELGLNILQSAEHSNCASARYFIDKLTQSGLKANRKLPLT